MNCSGEILTQTAGEPLRFSDTDPSCGFGFVERSICSDGGGDHGVLSRTRGVGWRGIGCAIDGALGVIVVPF